MVGESVGGYRIVREIGGGRAGVVYLAESIEHAHPVALKIVDVAEGDDARVRVERYLSDATAASALRHPGIVSVLAQGFSSNRQAYLVTEHVEGTTLRGWLAGSLASDLAARVTIARQVAAAGAAAHDHRIVHGALRPENVFLLGGSPDATKVTDFGLGRLLRRGDAADLAYASPERCRRPERADISDDVYAFGCLLYEMVCGRLPFSYQDRDALVAAHLGEPPPPLRTQVALLPAALDRLILATLCKSPDGRPRSLRAVEEQLGYLAAGGNQGVGESGWPATRQEASAPRLTPLGHVHLRPRELRVGMRSPSEARSRRTPLGQAHEQSPGTADDAPARPRATDVAVPEPGPLAEPDGELAGAREPARSGRTLGWLLGALALLAAAAVAARALRSRSPDASSLPAATAPVPR
jgi:serine/threonine protein kinase